MQCSCEICSVLTLIGSWGRVHPNHCIDVNRKCIDVNRKSSDKLNSMLKNCIHRKCGPMADKVKDAVVFLQNTPVGMCTYLFIAGNPPTINESNHFTKEITLLCSKLQFHQRTASFWQTMDGVSYGVELNKCSLLVFLLGRCNICAEKWVMSHFVFVSGAACLDKFCHWHICFHRMGSCKW